MTQSSEKGEKKQIFMGRAQQMFAAMAGTLAGVGPDVGAKLSALVVEATEFFLFQVEDGLVLPDDLLIVFE
jgi:hypothetical protein